MSWLTGWTYRKKITVAGQASAGTDYQVKLLVGESSGSVGDEFHIENHSTDFPSAKNDGGDLRFTSSDGDTLIDFWVEKVEGTTPNQVATIWVEVTENLDTNKDIYCYYGKSGATNYSDGDDTFVNFDDFEGISLDGAKWDSYGTISVADDEVSVGSGGKSWIHFKTAYSADYAIRAKSKASIDSSYPLILNETGAGNTNFCGFMRSGTSSFFISRATKSSHQIIDTDISKDSVYRIWDILREGTTKIYSYIDDVLKVTHSDTTYIPTVDLKPGFWSFETNPIIIGDWILVRKFTAIEPSFSSVDTEEEETPALEIIESDTITLSDNFEYEISKETILLNDTLNLSEAIQLNLSLEKQELADTLNFSDEIFYSTNKYLYLNDAINLSDEILSNVPKESIYKSDIVSLSDNIQLNLALEKALLEDTLHLTERYITVKPSFASQVAYGNSPYLLIVCDTDPSSLVKVDISGGTPTWDGYSLEVGTNQLKNAKAITINNTYNQVYIACAEGKVGKLPLSDLNDLTILSFSETNNLLTATTLDDYKFAYFGSNESTGELFILDESEVPKINTDFRFLAEKTEQIETIFDFIKGVKISSDFRFLSTSTNKVKTDFRWLKFPHTEAPQHLIPRIGSGFYVYIDGNNCTDVKMDSIMVTHTADSKSLASFVLPRHHDDLNHTIEGATQIINNQNAVTIYVDGRLIFSGYIDNLTCDSLSETVVVTCQAEEWDRNITTKVLSLPSYNTQLHPLDILIDNVAIYNPKIEFTTISNLSCTAGSLILNGSGFTSKMEEQVIDIQGGNFISGSYNIESYISSSQIKLDRTPTPKEKEEFSRNYVYINASGGTGNIAIDPEFYKGIAVNLGTSEIEDIEIWRVYGSFPSYVAQKLEDGIFKFRPTYTYFWEADVEIFGLTRKQFRSGWRYIGTSLGSLSTDLYEIVGAYYWYQRINDNVELDEGYYYVGSFPYREISCANGKFESKNRYVDKGDGCYWEREESYDYIDYAKNVAEIEYLKLKNIHGDILPQTSATITLTIDAFLFYNLKLLTRVNMENTTQAGIYHDNNGFPLSIKSIIINSKTMTSVIRMDNKMSQYELSLIDESYPEEPTIVPEESIRILRKYDLPTEDYIDY